MKLPIEEMHFSFARSSGAGGQNVNKLNTKAILKWNVIWTKSFSAAVIQRFLKRFENRLNKDGTIQISSEEFRSQARNKQACLEKLQKMLEQVLQPPKKRIPTKVSFQKEKKRKENNQRRSETKRRRKKIKDW